MERIIKIKKEINTMATYEVVYANHINEDGETYEFPTDKFDANSVELIDFSFVDSEIRAGEDFAREVWSYEIEDRDTVRFEDGLDRISTAISWKRTDEEKAAEPRKTDVRYILEASEGNGVYFKKVVIEE